MSYVWMVSVFMAFFCPGLLSLAAHAGELAGEVVSVQGSVFIRPDGKEARKLKPAKPGDSLFGGDVVNTPSDGKIKILMKDKSIVDLGPSALFKVESFKLNQGANREADVTMMYGTMRAAVTQKIEGKGRFKVRTPAATMGVRGTEFVVKAEVRNMEEIRHVVLNPDKPLPAPAAPKAISASGKPGAAPALPEAAKTEITVLQGQVDVKKEVAKPKDGRALSSLKEEKVVSLTAGTQITTKQGDVAPMQAVKLDTKALAKITSEVRLADNTFQKAVVIDTATAQATSSAAQEAVHAVLSSVAAAPPAMPVSAGELGLPGTFGVAQTFTQRPATPQNGNKNLTVIVKWRAVQ